MSEPTFESFPSRTSLDDLASIVRQIDAGTLSSVLIELAADYAAGHERIVRLQLSSQTKAMGLGHSKAAALG